jgi:hypothetical protein
MGPEECCREGGLVVSLMDAISDLDARLGRLAAASFHQLLVISGSIKEKTNLQSRLHVSDHGIVGIDIVFNGAPCKCKAALF